ncbi:MAG: right-handed parallel beta-helix repeat-containing protein [Chloroflexota bacterium]
MKVFRVGRLRLLAGIVPILFALFGITYSLSAQGQSFAPTVYSSGDCTTTVGQGESISDAISSAASGSIICVRGGIYNEQLRMTTAHEGLTVKAFPGERPILDGQGVLPDVTGSNKYAGLVHISGSNITVEGFEVRNSAGRGVAVVQQSGATEPLSNTTVRNMIIHHNWDSGINVNGSSDYYLQNVLIENNTVYENLQKNLNGQTGGSGLVFVEVENSTARGNVVHNNHGEGLVSGRLTDGITLEGNTSFDNDHANLYLINTQNPLVKGNLIYCTDDRTYWIPVSKSNPTVLRAGNGLQIRDESFSGQSTPIPPSSGQVIINNIVVGCGTNFGVATQISGGGLTNAVVANNAFINARGDTSGGVNNVRLDGGADFRNSYFVNNLMLQTSPGTNVRLQLALGNPDLSTFYVENNLYWPSEKVSTSWYPNEPGRVVADPLLVNPIVPTAGTEPDPGDYGPSANSPVIDAGKSMVEIVDDFFGHSRSGLPDIGAIEYVSDVSQGQILVSLEASPSDDPTQFSFTADYPPGTFELGSGQSQDSGLLDAGAYNVVMTPVPGWDLIGAACDDGSDPADIGLSDGEVVNCVFSVEKTQEQTGTIVVRKETIPSEATDLFTFSSSFSAEFQLGNGQAYTSDPLVAGTYSVQEAQQEGWALTSATCTNGSDPSSINLIAGETVTCTFVNTKDVPQTGTIIISKETDPDGAPDLFTFDASYADDFQLADGQSNTSDALTAGTYSVEEIETAGWTLTSVTCDDGSDPSAIELDAGETVHCTFYNQQTPTSNGDSDTLYLSAKRAGSVADISYGFQDILAFDLETEEWSLFLDLSDVGVSRNLNGFAFLDDGSILLTFGRNQTLTGLGTITPKDIVRFVPTSTGETTDGYFEWYLDGSDVDLTTSGEVIDSLALAPDGRVIISTKGTARIKDVANQNFKARDEDMIVFTPTHLGQDTTGSWALYFDGSTIQGLGVEDIGGAWLDDTNGDLYITVATGFNIGGVRGNTRDILRLRPSNNGYDVQKFWFGRDYGFSGVPNAFDFVR